MACQLLLEITTFLRETYRFLPKASRSKYDVGGGGGGSRRWSSGLGSPGHSERSNSRSSQGELSHLAGMVDQRALYRANRLVLWSFLSDFVINFRFLFERRSRAQG